MSENTIPETTETTTQAAPANQEIASINGKHYYKSSMSEELIAAFEQAIKMDEKIQIKQIEARDLTYARQFLINIVEEGADTMEEYIPPVDEDAELDTEDLAKAETTETAKTEVA